jgi:uncharacterized membrane protein
MKGAGHLLQENFWKAILFLTIRHLLVSTSCFFLFFGFVGKEGRKYCYKILSYVAIATIVLALGYTFYQVSNTMNEDYDRADRLVEIALTWLLRVIGFFIGYKLANALSKHSSQQEYIS